MECGGASEVASMYLCMYRHPPIPPPPLSSLSSPPLSLILSPSPSLSPSLFLSLCFVPQLLPHPPTCELACAPISAFKQCPKTNKMKQANKQTSKQTDKETKQVTHTSTALIMHTFRKIPQPVMLMTQHTVLLYFQIYFEELKPEQMTSA